MSISEPVMSKPSGLRKKSYLLAAIVAVVLLVLLSAVLVYQQSRPVPVGQDVRLENALRAGTPEFEQFRNQVVISDLVAATSTRVVGDVVTELTARITNRTGRTINGLEMRGSVVDKDGNAIKARTLVIIPTRIAALNPGANAEARILIEGISPDAPRKDARMEVTGLRFE